MNTATTNTAIADLLSILDLETLEVNLFRGHSPQTGWQRVFGGQVIGQALVAATRTVEGSLPHSLHAYFLLARSQGAIVYEVDRIRTARASRRGAWSRSSTARDLLHVGVVSREEEGLDHQMKMPDVPQPDTLRPTPRSRKDPAATAEAVRRYYERPRPIELRPVEFGRYSGKARPMAASTSGCGPREAA